MMCGGSFCVWSILVAAAFLVSGLALSVFAYPYPVSFPLFSPPDVSVFFLPLTFVTINARAGTGNAKINASYKKAEIKIISQSEPDMRRIKAEIEKTGYSFLGGHSEPYSKKGFFASLFGK